ncbi:MAG: hypothetical protein NTX44_16035 [Ignavibacteriales bacterium]|nr:hypothetical protein [Ignavibacteriales bacterium]
MKKSSKIFLIISLIWSITTTICCILIITVSTWTMMHIESYNFFSKWVILQVVLSILILPVLFILLRTKLFPERQRFYLITKRIQVVVAILYLFTVFFEVNRYERFIKFNSLGPYKSLSGKQIVPINTSTSEVINGRKIFTVIYQSEINGADTLALRQEAMYVWQQIIVDADKQNANFATVSTSSVSNSNNDSISNIISIISTKDSLGVWKVLYYNVLPNHFKKERVPAEAGFRRLNK